jgi:hypothetical protein
MEQIKAKIAELQAVSDGNTEAGFEIFPDR